MQNKATMAGYSIKEIESLTGVKAHTIRIWEKRYNIITPKRTDTNIRYYDDAQLRHLLNISTLNHLGYKISKLSKLSQDELTELIDSCAVSDNGNDALIAKLIDAMIELDEEKFNHSFQQSIQKRGFESTMIQIIYPFLSRIGTLWTIGSIIPGQEHFVSNLIRQKLITNTAQLNVGTDEQKPLFALFLPEGEFHEIGLLLMNYMLRSRRYPTLYLGAAVRILDIKEVIEIKKVKHLFTIITTGFANPDIFLESLSKIAPSQTIFLSGPIKPELTDISKNITILPDCDSALQLLDGNSL